jgi:hypothetical protein
MPSVLAKKMKTIHKSIILTTLTILAASALSATTISATDPFFSGDSCGNSSCDVVGDRFRFDIQSATVNLSRESGTIDLFFNYGGIITNGLLGSSDNFYSFNVANLNLNVGDFFFTVNGTPEWAVIVDSHSDLAAGDLYKLNGNNGALTASQVLGNPQGVPYRPTAFVWANNNAMHEGDGMTQVVNLNNPGNGTTDAEWHVQITFAPSSDLLAAASQSGFGFQFESATSGGDIITGRGPAQAPEPRTLAFLGAGLLALGCFRYKRSKNLTKSI